MIDKISSAIIRWGFYLLFIVVPLILTPWNYELFEFNKMITVYILTIVITTAWIVKMAHNREIRIAKTPLDIPIIFFFASQLISSAFSIDPHVSWFGYYSRFNGGMWSVISYILLYYAFVSNFPKEKIQTLLKIILSTGAVVAFYGLLERMGIDKHLWVQDVQSRVFSTLGQPNWLAAYLVALLPLSMAKSLKSQAPNPKSQNTSYWSLGFVFWVLISLLFFFVLLSTRSRSGLLGFAVADALFWLLISIKHKPFTFSLRPFTFIHLAFALILFFNGSYVESIDKYFSFQSVKKLITTPSESTETQPAAPQPSGTLLEYGGTASSKIRQYVWTAAIDAWMNSPKNMAVGTGTETFAWTFFKYRPVEHNMVSEWDFLYNKAHNEYLNYLATTGIFGLGSYIIFICSFLFFSFKSIIYTRHPELVSGSRLNEMLKQVQHDNTEILSYALIAGWASILVTNFFGFSVVIIQVLFFLIPAILTVSYDPEIKSIPITGRISRIVLPFSLLLTLYLTVATLLYWYADTLYAKGYRANRQGAILAARQYLEHAITLRGSEPNYYDELANALSVIAVSDVSEGKTEEGANLARSAVEKNELSLAISPSNVNYWKTRTKIFYSLAEYNPEYLIYALEALRQAIDLSPNDPKILYNMAILYGRQNDTDTMIEYMEKAKSIKPNYRDAYVGLSVVYQDLGEIDKAKRELETYLSAVDPGDQDIQNRLEAL